ncbi:MAG: HAMP domain-containing sensor histidine kinase [Myxococcota bacterium]
MTQSLPRRLLIGAAMGSVVVGVLMIAGLRTARPAIQAASSQYQLAGVDHDACNADPASWGWSSGDVSFYGYDRLGRSANADAPSLEEDLRQSALAGDAAVAASAGRAVTVVAFDTDAPCALIRVTSRNVETRVGRWLTSILGGAISLGVLISLLGTFWLVVRPLRRRIDALAAEAGRVGSSAFAPQPRESDALGHISAVLNQSHQRIVDTRDALEARNQALERHLAEVAHDLRTPLASMHLALEELSQQSLGPERKEAQRALADAVYLSSMVENLHQATRLRHEVDVSSGSVDMTDLIHRLEQRFAIVGRHAGVEVAANTPGQPVTVSCTPALAERAIANLVQNAVEHNNGPGHVAIALSLVDSGRRFRLIVADDGPGVPKETLASLQNESFLADKARPRGPGMGTLITKEVARRAGWSISYAALEPVGLEVQLEGPVARSSRGEERPEKTE